MSAPAGALARLRRTRRALATIVVARAVLRALAAGLVVLGVGAAGDLVVPVPLGVREALRTVALVAAASALVVTLWQGRFVLSARRVALWVEERQPRLAWALVTALDERGPWREALEDAVARTRWDAVVRRAGVRALLPSAAAAGALIAFIGVLPFGTVARVALPRPGDALARHGIPSRETTEHLTPLVARVIPPAYAGSEVRVLDEPATIDALPGSVIELDGRGNGSRIRADVAGVAAGVDTASDTWSVTFTMPARPAAARLGEGDAERLVVLSPTRDAPPEVQLLLPARDSVLRAPAGRLTLSAVATDDIGVVSAAFELIISSGEGETFTFRTARIGAVAPGGATGATLSAALLLDTLRLRPGDLLHVRAVARDGNTVGGPGEGTSETRVLRIARPGEYDSLAVEGAPPPAAERSALGERMLILRAEALVRQRGALDRGRYVAESQRIGDDQTQLRRAVAGLVFARLGAPAEEESSGAGAKPLTPDALLGAADAATGGAIGRAMDVAGAETPVVGVSRPLLEAYDAMWEAGGALGVGEPERALPHMRAALEALERARQAERAYLRGRPPALVVDLARVRMAGRERGDPAARAPSPVLDGAAAARAERYARAIALLDNDPRAALDSLTMLRVDLLSAAPGAADALGRALDVLRDGRDATAALLDARRALEGTPAARDSLVPWRSGGGSAP